MGSPKICVVITARDTEDVVETIGRVETHRPDLIEIRLDYLEGPCGLDVIRSASKLPLHHLAPRFQGHTTQGTPK
jgi:3-dehydroquinate dehydratase